MDRPYKGLSPYTQEDADYFFGRDVERKIIAASLRASRLTLLYGESGVGKTSILSAGVAYDLSEDSDYTVHIFRSWRSDPIYYLTRLLRQSLDDISTISAEEEDLIVLAKAHASSGARKMLIVLDQFEDYFRFHINEHGDHTLANELPRLLNSSCLSINFLIAVRDDTFAAMDVFRDAIPSIFDNAIRIEALDPDSATESIIKPLEVFNARATTMLLPSIEKAVAEQVAAQLIAAQGNGQKRVQPAYLQLVMDRWWQHEQSGGSPQMREETLAKLGGVKRIVENHFDETMEGIKSAESVAAALFQFMITPAGRSMPQTVSECLARGFDESKVNYVLDELEKARVIASITPPRGSKADERCYEFAHDAVARAALKWRNNYVEAEKLAAARQRGKEEEKGRTLRLMQLFSLVSLIVAIVALWAWVSERRAHNQVLQDEQQLMMLSTTYAATFPEHLTRAADLITKADQNDSIDILVDFIGTGHYSLPNEFRAYANAIETSKAHVRMLIYGPKAARDVLEGQFIPNQFRKEDDGANVGYYDIEQESFATYEHYIKYYSRIMPLLKRPATYQEFMDTILSTQNYYCRKFIDESHIAVRAIPETRARDNIYFWMVTGKEALFAFPKFPRLKEGYSFSTGDRDLLDIFKQEFETKWAVATGEGDVRSICYESVEERNVPTRP